MADALSQALVSQLPVTEQSDLGMVCAVVDAQLTDRKITAVGQATSEDKTLQKVQQLIKEGWPSDNVTKNANYACGNFHACAFYWISKTASAGPGADTGAGSSIVTCAASRA